MGGIKIDWTFEELNSMSFVELESIAGDQLGLLDLDRKKRACEANRILNLQREIELIRLGRVSAAPVEGGSD